MQKDKYLDRYQSFKLVGKGFTGKTYLANDTYLNKMVIIKAIYSDYLWHNLYQIKSELLNISCEQIVKIYDIVSLEQGNYVIQQYIEGTLLRDCISSLNFTLKDFLNISIDICKALLYLKNKNLIHRDIKPSNIIYNQNMGRAYLIDIDLITSVALFKKSDNEYAGTFSYSAPEHIKENNISSSADVYSFGLVLYETIQGTLPFKNNREGIINKIDNQYEISFDMLNPEITLSDRIASLISSMIKFDPNDRISPEDALLEFEKILGNSQLTNIPLRTNKILTTAKENNQDQDVIRFDKDLDVAQSVILYTSSLYDKDVLSESSSSAWSWKDWDKHLSMNKYAKKHDKDDLDKDNLKNSHVKYLDKIYQRYLLKEYDSILIQARIAFWLWVIAFAICYMIIGTSIILICLGRYMEALTTVVLNGLIYAVQRLFSIREDYYWNLINNKIKHLEVGDYWDYAFERLSYLDDDKERNKKAIELLDSIRKRNDKAI